MNTKEIDYLYEDPDIPGQRYGLVSIVGPNMPQKCDVWGLKIRGVADSLDRAKTMTQKLMRIDKDYDIYTVEIGKFFPLSVNPLEVSDVEYQNTQLNELIKGYLESKELANEQWQERKNEMVKQALIDGKNQEDRREHPVAIWQRISMLKEQLEKAKVDLEASEIKFASYTEQEREDAKNQTNEDVTNNVDSTLEKLQKYDTQYKELEDMKKNGVDNENLEKINEQLESIKLSRTELVNELQDKKKVNEYINSNYSNSEYSYLDSNVREI